MTKERQDGNVFIVRNEIPRSTRALYKHLHGIRDVDRSHKKVARKKLAVAVAMQINDDKPVQLSRKKAPLSSLSQWKQSMEVQTSLVRGNQSIDIHNKKLNKANADFVHCKGLPFDHGEDPKFCNLIKLSKNVSTYYKPPARGTVGEQLLEQNYAKFEKRRDENLLHKADTYGLLMYGDGAAIHKMPHLNILVSGVSNPAAVIEIVDCTSQLENGGIKDAKFIAEQLLLHMLALDPDRTRIDVVNFDGGSNFQKAAQVVREIFPRVEVVHSAEHVVSLYFKDILKHPLLKNLVDFYRLLYRIFGGSRHTIFAAFKKHSIIHNMIAIGLLRPADTRMAGHIIALRRLIQLKVAFQMLIASPEYARLKIDSRVTAVLVNQMFWRLLVEVFTANMGNLALLRKCDQKFTCSDELDFCSQS